MLTAIIEQLNIATHARALAWSPPPALVLCLVSCRVNILMIEKQLEKAGVVGVCVCACVSSRVLVTPGLVVGVELEVGSQASF